MRSRAIDACLAVAVLASGVLVLAWQSHLTFFLDDWDILIYRQGGSASSFLDPHAEHILLAPVSIYKLLLAVFGMDSMFPFQVVSTSLFLLAAVLLFVYVRRRTDPWLALLATVLILFLGAAWRDILWTFQIGFSGSLAAGLGMVLALDRDDRAGDRIGCALLAISLTFSTLGLAFAAGAVADIATGGRRRATRLYLVVVPLALFAAWWLGWGHEATSSLSFHNVVHSPRYVFDAVSQGIAGLFGLATTANPAVLGGLGWGRLVLVVAIGLAIWRLRRVGEVPRGLWIALAAGAGFWFLAAFNTNLLRAPTSGRYVYPSGFFILLIAAELLRGVRLTRGAAIAVTVVVAAAVTSSIVFFHRGYEQFRMESVVERADLAALEIARPSIEPGFTLDPQTAGGSWLVPVPAGSYFSAIEASGSPAYSESEVAAQSDPVRQSIDQLLALAEGLQLRAVRGEPSPPAPEGASTPTGGSVGRRCRKLSASSAPKPLARLGPGGITLEAGRPSVPGAPVAVDVLLGRFSDGLPLTLGSLQPGSPRSLLIPADASVRPWRLGLTGFGQSITLCRLSGV